MKSQHCIDTILPMSRPGFGLPPWLVTPFHRLGQWLESRRQREHLALLDDHMLRDIGLSRADVRMELDKPFWQP